MQAKGIRAYVGKLSMDISSRPTYVEPSAETSLESARAFSRDCQGLTSDLPEHERLVQPILTPRFVPTCSNDLLQGLGSLAKERNLWVQSHMAESLDQVKWVKEKHGLDDIDVLDKVHNSCLLSLGVLADPNTAWPFNIEHYSSTLYVS